MALDQQRLRQKQKVFIEHYLTTWNATEAARRAGYTRGGSQIGAMLMSKLSIQSAIAQRLRELHASANETIALVTTIARGPMVYFLSDTGEIDLTSEQALKHKHLLKTVKTKVDERYTKDGERIVTRSIEIQTRDADAMLTLLAKHHSLLGDTSPIINQNNTLVVTNALETIQKQGLSIADVLAELPAIVAAMQSQVENKSENTIDSTTVSPPPVDTTIEIPQDITTNTNDI